MAFSGPLCVRFGFFFSREDMKHHCKAKLACHPYQGLDCLPCGKTQQPYMPFSDLSGLLARMLGMARCCPGMCLALAKVSLSGRKKGKGALLLIKEQEEGPQTEQPSEIFYVQAGPIRNSARSHPHSSFPPTPGRGAGPLVGGIASDLV